MLTLTKLEKSTVVVNVECVKYIEEIPDTLIHFVNGDSLLVLESTSEIVEQMQSYQATVLCLAGRVSHK